MPELWCDCFRIALPFDPSHHNEILTILITYRNEILTFYLLLTHH